VCIDDQQIDDQTNGGAQHPAIETPSPQEFDVRAQERWDEFTNVKYEMLKRTHTTHAPWKIIRGNDKHQARLNAIKVILNSVPYQRLDASLDFVPDPQIVISGARELEKMEAQRLRGGKFLA
jgi:hypothetical protein